MFWMNEERDFILIPDINHVHSTSVAKKGREKAVTNQVCQSRFTKSQVRNNMIKLMLMFH